MKTLPWLRNALLIAALAALSSFAFAQIQISITVAPPSLPIYEQPPCPAPNLIWTPGYWAWSDDGYYWVPGSWVEAPAVGLLWTPGYWEWENGNYLWNDGYWAQDVGFYGGVDYGYGYPGEGYYGGRWMGDAFSYNVAVVNINNTVIRNTYRNEVRYREQPDRVSFNGGRGGIQARPTPGQMTARQHRRYGPITAQTRQANLARSLRQNYARVNNGHPEHAAMPRPARSAADFSRSVPARAARPAPGTRPNNARPNNAAPNNATPDNERPNNARPNNNVRPAPVTPARPNTRLEARPNARPTPQPGARPETRPNNRPENRPNAHPERQPGNRDAQPEPKPVPRPEARPQPRNNVRPEAQPDRGAQPEPRPQPRPENRSQPRPEARPQPHQQAHPEARPQGNEQQPKPEGNPHKKEPQV